MAGILIFSKEFNRGEPVSDFCHHFAERMKERGIRCDLVCFGVGNEETVPMLDGYLTIHRVPFVLHADSYFNWVMLMNNELKRKGRELAESQEYVLVIGNDWTSSPAATSIASFFNIPLATIMHSTEQNRGFHYDNSRPISDIEWEACYMSRRVVAMTADCRNSLLFDLKVPADKILSAENLFEYLRLLEEVARQT
jgi:hypothetical protein